MGLTENTQPLQSCIKHSQDRVTLGGMDLQTQQQMNEDLGGRGEIPQQVSNVTEKKTMRGGDLSQVDLTVEVEVSATWPSSK